MRPAERAEMFTPAEISLISLMDGLFHVIQKSFIQAWIWTVGKGIINKHMYPHFTEKNTEGQKEEGINWKWPSW